MEAVQTTVGSRFEAFVARLVGRPFFWILLVLSIASYPVVHSLRSSVPPPPPILGSVPEFTLPDQSGRTLHFSASATPGFDELRGKVWIANLLSPKDPVSSPFLSRLSSLQTRVENLGANFAFVSFCKDVTAAELVAVAKAHRNSPRLWKLLAGVPEPVRTAFLAGFHEAIHGEPGGIDIEAMDRGNTLILVDQQGRIRGYFDGSDLPSVNGLMRETGLIANHLN